MISPYTFYTKSFLATVIIIVCILVIRFFIRNQSNITKNILWVILLIRLLFPISVYTSWGIVMPAASHENETVSPVMDDNEINIVSADTKNKISKNYQSVETSVNTYEKYRVNCYKFFYYMGIAVFFVYFLISVIMIRKRMRYAKKTLDFDNVYEWPDDFSACVIGIIKPRIYVPCGLDNKQFDTILRHERMHIQRGDYLFLLFYYFALAVNWFNPLCYVVFFLARSDIELACDELVLKNCSTEERQDYARTLLQLCKRNNTRQYLLVSFAKGGKQMKKRVLNIGKNYKDHKKISVIAGIAAIMMLAGGVFLYSGTGNNSNAYSESELLKISEKKSHEDFDATMPQIGYADDRRLILYDSDGVYLFDLTLTSSHLTDYIDFEEHNLGPLQGAEATSVFVSATGNAVFISYAGRNLVYNVPEKKFEDSISAIDSFARWNPEFSEESSIKKENYYSVSTIPEGEYGESFFLALDRNLNPNYAALLYVVSNEQSDKIYTLFH